LCLHYSNCLFKDEKIFKIRCIYTKERMDFYSSDHLDGLFRDVVSWIILEFGL